jgi:hypothetical protein
LVRRGAPLHVDSEAVALPGVIIDENKPRSANLPPLDGVEPHAPLLNIPPVGQLLYKVMTIENLVRSVSGSYLYFNRIDNYKDFKNSDPNDGQELPEDRKQNRHPLIALSMIFDRRWRRRFAGH